MSLNFYTSRDPDYVSPRKMAGALSALQKEGVPITILVSIAHQLVCRVSNDSYVEGTPMTLQMQARLTRAGENYGGTVRAASVLLSKWIAGRTLGIEIDPLGWFPVAFTGDAFTTNGQNKVYIEDLTDRLAGTPEQCLLKLLQNLAPAGSMLLACMMQAPNIEGLLVDVYGNHLSHSWLRTVSYGLSQEMYLETVAGYLQGFGWKPKEGYTRATFTYPAIPKDLTPEIAYVKQFLSVSEHFRNLPEKWQFDFAASSLLSLTTVNNSIHESWYQWAGDIGGSRHQVLSTASMFSLLNNTVTYSTSPLPELWLRIAEVIRTGAEVQFFAHYTGLQDLYEDILTVWNDEDKREKFKEEFEQRFQADLTSYNLSEIADPYVTRHFYDR